MIMRKVMKSNLLPISAAGFKYIGYAAIALIVFTIVDLEFLAFITFIVLVGFIFVFRNPERELLTFESNNVLSPVDGRVTAIEDLKDSKYAYKIDIESNYFDVGVLRVPLDARLESLKIQRGARLAESSSLNKKINENAELTFVDNNSNSIKVKHSLARSFDSVHMDVVESQDLRQSARYGFIVQGITTIYLPHNFRVNLSIGSELKASETLIGYFS